MTKKKDDLPPRPQPPRSESLEAHLTYMQARSLSRTHITDRRRAITRLALFLDADPLHATYDDLFPYLSTVSRSTRPREVRRDQPPRAVLPLVPGARLPAGRPDASPTEAEAAQAASSPHERAERRGGHRGSATPRPHDPRPCGLRRVASVRDRSPALDIPSLVAHGKGNKDRIVPMCDRVLSELQTYGVPQRGPLFPRLDGRPGAWTGPRVSMVANLYLHDQGIADTLHSLRHRFATRCQAETGNLLVVATLLGHENPATTMLYAQYDNRAGYEAVQALGGRRGHRRAGSAGQGA